MSSALGPACTGWATPPPPPTLSWRHTPMAPTTALRSSSLRPRISLNSRNVHITGFIVTAADPLPSSSQITHTRTHKTSALPLQGKAGFPEPGCFEGAKEFPDTWCDFGCAIRELDPHNKFDDQSMLWNYEGVDLERCCSKHGFMYHKKGCECNPKPKYPSGRSSQAALPSSKPHCPPPPGFTVPLNDFDYDCDNP